jgi:serralysin
MLAASHLLGVDALAKWISSGGTADLRDPYGTPLTEYITSFQPYDVPFGPSNPGAMASSVYGTEGADTLMGGMGHDWIFGLGGDDELVLTAGNDTLDGGSGSDWVAVRGSTAVKMDLTLGKQDTGLGHHTFISIENLRGGSGADTLRGDNAANELRGEGGNDTLDGRGGADRIIGGAGRDVMSGGLDNATDVFVFTKVSDSGIGRAADIIRDFQRGIDLIDLSGIDANRSLSGDQHFSFASGARAYSVWAVQSKGTLIIWGDTTGDHKADFEIRLTGVNGLSANDLIL